MVVEPTSDDAIAILRGIKENTRSTTACALPTMPLWRRPTFQRYITDRFLPDKAIDLIDEATSALRMAIDSMPVDLDKMKREMIKIEIENARWPKKPTKNPKNV